MFMGGSKVRVSLDLIDGRVVSLEPRDAQSEVVRLDRGDEKQKVLLVIANLESKSRG
jgi:hypothetical protein